jgi:hypothetical protein
LRGCPGGAGGGPGGGPEEARGLPARRAAPKPPSK